MNDIQFQLSRLSNQPDGKAATSRIASTRSHVERQLQAYGEDAVAAKLSSISDADFDRIGERAFGYACTPAKKNGGRMLLDRALALAAVEVIEGAPRELCRKRRVYTARPA